MVHFSGAGSMQLMSTGASVWITDVLVFAILLSVTDEDEKSEGTILAYF